MGAGVYPGGTSGGEMYWCKLWMDRESRRGLQVCTYRSFTLTQSKRFFRDLVRADAVKTSFSICTCLPGPWL